MRKFEKIIERFSFDWMVSRGSVHLSNKPGKEIVSFTDRSLFYDRFRRLCHF